MKEERTAEDPRLVCTRYAKAFIKAVDSNKQSLTANHHQSVWRLPDAGSIKINTDGAIDFINHRSTIGFIVRDTAGLVLSAQSRTVGYCSPLFVELWAVYYSLDWAWKNGYRNIILEIDSKLTYKTIKDTSRWQGKQRAWISKIDFFMQQDWQVKITHIFREANHFAHWLARKGLGLPDSYFDFIDCIPISLNDILYSDWRGVQPHVFDINKIHQPFPPGRGQHTWVGVSVGWSYYLKKNGHLTLQVSHLSFQGIVV